MQFKPKKASEPYGLHCSSSSEQQLHAINNDHLLYQHLCSIFLLPKIHNLIFFSPCKGIMAFHLNELQHLDEINWTPGSGSRGKEFNKLLMYFCQFTFIFPQGMAPQSQFNHNLDFRQFKSSSNLRKITHLLFVVNYDVINSLPSLNSSFIYHSTWCTS